MLCLIVLCILRQGDSILPIFPLFILEKTETWIQKINGFIFLYKENYTKI